MSPPSTQSQHQHAPSAGADTAGIFTYQPLAGFYDEAMTADGSIRDHWSSLLNSLQKPGLENLSRRQRKAQRILRDDGVTYRPWNDREHAWQLDPVPLLLDNETWQSIESGLLQRTELFNRLLIDIYGSQELIRQGVIPPEAVFTHPGFLRPCFGIQFPSEQALLLHAVDMIRTEDKQVCVIGDRTQSPDGAGYALENRTVMNRVFPGLFRNNQVHRLALFFQSLRYKLNELAPNNELPNIVVLTPGSASESYFEHAYLANYLGYSLVQGRDLTVRNGHVWTKSLSGLSRVDVIFRRVDDSYCDPAELKSDSLLGVPGLLEVIRSGKVVVANPLGSGILESPVFLKYLPAIARSLLGQDLQLPFAPTRWAQDPVDREFMLDNIRQLIIKPVLRRTGQGSVLGSELDAAAINRLQHQIQQQPLRYVAQDYINPAFAPCWQQQQLVPLPTVLRSFTVAGENSCSVMPGGLVRVGRLASDRLISNQTSALSKDVWILASGPEKQVSLWPDTVGHIPVSGDQQQNLPSRVIENMFWLGRYSVRAEYALRFLRTVFVQLNSTNQLSAESYRTILLAVTQVTETFPGFGADNSLLFRNPEKELIAITIDPNRPGSVIASLDDLLNSAGEVKVLLSADTQQIINDIRDNVDLLEQSLLTDFASAPEEALDPLVTSLLALSGLVHESMMRGYGWRFMEIGRNLERAYQTMSMIRALLVPVLNEYDEDSVLETVLLTLETLITYRRRYRARTDVVHGLELTLLDDTNPRSLNYVLQELNAQIGKLPDRQKSDFLSRQRRITLELLSRIQLARPDQLCALDRDTQSRPALDRLMQQSQASLNDLATVLSDVYFDHTETHQQVLNTSWEDEL